MFFILAMFFIFGELSVRHFSLPLGNILILRLEHFWGNNYYTGYIIPPDLTADWHCRFYGDGNSSDTALSSAVRHMHYVQCYVARFT